MNHNNKVIELNIIDKKTLFDLGDKYVIPHYQRPYAWEQKEIVQLIEDIDGLSDDNRNYYIGSLVVSRLKKDADMFEVVDGQQRLTTLFLLLNYLNLIKEPVPALSFECRPVSNTTLGEIQQIIAHITNRTRLEEKKIESYMREIFSGVKDIHQKFEESKIDKDDFIEKLKRVVLFRIEVPEHTDLNRYFEIMNTRGEQLEMHDILKADLMGAISQENEAQGQLFATIWDACADMDGYVQMHFNTDWRAKIFGNSWNDFPDLKWEDFTNMELTDSSVSNNSLTLNQIINAESIEKVKQEQKDYEPDRFESIINFPFFLLHTLRVYIKQYGHDTSTVGRLLDDKKLLSDFNTIINLEGNKRRFAKRFIILLLKTRFQFDKYIIKREFLTGDKDGKWSLKELQVSAKKAYYVETKLKSFENSKEWNEKTLGPRNNQCLMIQAALRVSYTSPKIMHWITELLNWLAPNPDGKAQLLDEALNYARKAVNDNFLKSGDFKLGTLTPHIVFNYLDYLLWKRDNYKEGFAFEFRNSVEHWYPQHPLENKSPWDDKDTFGNLCIVSRSVNSRFSNLSPESKMKSYGDSIAKGSLKLRLMGEIIEKHSEQKWIDQECRIHEEEMLELLQSDIAENLRQEGVG